MHVHMKKHHAGINISTSSDATVHRQIRPPSF